MSNAPSATKTALMILAEFIAGSNLNSTEMSSSSAKEVGMCAREESTDDPNGVLTVHRHVDIVWFGQSHRSHMHNDDHEFRVAPWHPL